MKSSLFHHFVLISILALAVGVIAATSLAPATIASEPTVGEMTMDPGEAAEIFKKPGYSSYAEQTWPINKVEKIK